MKIEDGKFYFIKQEFFEIFNEYNLMQNKENGNKRPCYFCFRDDIDKDIIWFVPISSKVEKYKFLLIVVIIPIVKFFTLRIQFIIINKIFNVNTFFTATLQLMRDYVKSN